MEPPQHTTERQHMTWETQIATLPKAASQLHVTSILTGASQNRGSPSIVFRGKQESNRLSAQLTRRRVFPGFRPKGDTPPPPENWAVQR